MEMWHGQPVGLMRRELGFHSVQSDRRQLLYGLPANPPSSTNQIARCSFEESHPPFFGRNPTPLGRLVGGLDWVVMRAFQRALSTKSSKFSHK